MLKIVERIWSKSTPIAKVIIKILLVCIALALIAFAIFNVYKIITVSADMAEMKEEFETKREQHISKMNEMCSDVANSCTEVHNTYRIEFIAGTECTLITNGTEAFLVDVGNEEDGMYIAAYLKEKGIDNIKAVICTSQKDEYTGGVLPLLKSVNVEMVVASAEFPAAGMVNGNGVILTVTTGDVFTIGDANIEIVYAATSLVVKVELGEMNILLTSDVSLDETFSLPFDIGDITVLKVPNHGTAGSITTNILQRLTPDYAVVTNNEVAESDRMTLNGVRKFATTFRTEKHGTIVFLTNGVTMNVSSE